MCGEGLDGRVPAVDLFGARIVEEAIERVFVDCDDVRRDPVIGDGGQDLDFVAGAPGLAD